jgi:hypothetical protein
MTQACDVADGEALTRIARAIAVESQQLAGEARAGRLRLLQNFNSKLSALGRPQIEACDSVSLEDVYELLQSSIADETLCAHTRNFLQMVTSRLDRFDSSTPVLQE